MNVPSKSLTLPAIPIRDMVLFPGSRLPFMVGRRSSVRTMELAIKAGDHLVMLTQRDPKEEEPKQESLYSMGTLALVESLIPVPKDHYKVGVRGIARVKLERYLDEGDVVQAEVTILAEPSSPESALLPTFNQAVQALLLRNPELARSFSMESLQELPLGGAIDAVAGALPVEVREKQQVLDQLELEPRLHTLLRMLELDAARHRLEGDAEDKTRQSRGSEHRPFVLGEKMGGAQASGRKGEKDEISRLRDQILKVEMGEEAEKKALEELDRLESMAPQSAESTVSRSYIEWLLALPWNVYADEHLDLEEAERILDEDHSGLEKVKVRILEYLAVMRRLRDSSSQRGSAGLRGPILCLVGPPGVGKTSLARSIARALNRPFLRFSLGGLRDEAEIRGHRRTYIGSMPGRIISLMKKGAVRNPVMLLDEIDKMGADWRGDPSSALLEVLDPEQNFSFQDHYLDVGFDLSQVLFLATANVRHQIPQPLEDRLEVLELSSYTLREKRAIAQAHLVPKALERHGMENMDIRFEDAAIDKIIQDYTKEAGVRQLEREISGVLRKLARQSLQPAANGSPGFDGRVSAERLPKLLGPEIFLEAPLGRQQPPGVVHGLAWTPFGGDLLTIEAAKLPGKGNLRLTGKLGEVMQESANLALSFVRMRSESLGLKPDFMEQVDLHVHLPEGAIPKDGPSAGITLAMALISVLTGIPVRPDLAMTGELTLRGMVLPIGGLKEKLLAAHRMGCTTVLIPLENARHLEELPLEVREQLTIHLVAHMDEVIRLALVRPPVPLLAAEPSPAEPSPGEAASAK